MSEHQHHAHLNPGEKLIMGLNDHWYVVLSKVVIFFICASLFTAFFVFSVYLMRTHRTAGLVMFTLTLFFFVILIHWFFLQLIQWSLSNWYITTHQVIEFETNPYVKNNVRYIKVSEIHEIEKYKIGLMQNILDFGEVRMNVAALPDPLVFKNVPSPSRFTAILEAIRKSQRLDEKTREKIKQIAIRKYRVVDH